VGLREFNFDGVLPPNCSQKFTYETTCRSLVCDLLNGLNATALVYGQTSSGKTYTMFGAEDSFFGRETEASGIVSRACIEIFQAIQHRRQECGIEAQVAISYVEIYGDRISDLLKNGARCGHSKAAAQQYVLQGAAERVVENLDDIKAALVLGETCKRRAATAMNDRSTRAHSIFILSLRQTKVLTGVSRTSKLFLADLGGSEQVKKSLADVNAGAHRHNNESNTEFSAGFELGDRMREAVYINLGLLALKKCIEALNQGNNYVPYQDSKLTMLLSAGLGGNSKTAVIVCSRLESSYLQETVTTLRFGEKCSMIENQISSEDIMLANILKDLDQQIRELEALIVQKERWELVEDRREDVLAEDGTMEKAVGGIERRTVTRLVGAESERKVLEALLKKRAQFIGTALQDGELEVSLLY
jgi:kinesin family member 5